MAVKEGITETLKAENQMLWIQRMGNIQSRAREIVNTYTLDKQYKTCYTNNSQ